ncbi:MAG: phosphoenolpyruvate--protein phosphotransferase [Ruminococcaceae bacterium]|nr:phosphoenolpyruvate--protein phosphotransferase [Oscillospiraceae bacterium]
MMEFKGKGVCSAIAIGHARVIKKQAPSVQKREIIDTEGEILRYLRAKDKATRALRDIHARALVEVGEANAQIFEIHLMMLDDEDYTDSVFSIIRNQKVNAEWAISVTCSNFAELMSTMNDSYMRERASDIRDISSRLISCLTGEGGAQESGEKCIICADDLTPSETVTLDKKTVLAFLCAHGSSSSHSAILARSMGIPAIIGLGDEFLESVTDGALMLVNGYTGEVVIEPNDEQIKRYEALLADDINKKELLKNLKGKDTITLDGTRISLYANIGGTHDIAEALFCDAEGIGLFRSEFLYLNRDDFPSEDEQFASYKKVLESMGEKRVIIRTLDIGADKQASYFDIPREENPALGFRAIRICLARPELFKTQLRALYRASAFGNLGIMFPMITSIHEVERALDICAEVKYELDTKGIAYSKSVEIGIMIETPASAIISDSLAPLVDFFSVGTNDLTQYTLACDRQNGLLDDFCDTHHEAVLRLIELSAKNAHKSGAWIGICGELASDISLTERFLKMGIDELSVSPSYILKVRDAIRKIDLSK